MPPLNVASLFTGIGGIDLGFARAGHVIRLQVERDERCKRVLRARFPGVALLHDVEAVLPSALEGIDVLVAGFPCVDCSTLNATRPGLKHGRETRAVAHVFRLLEGERVPWVVFENVTGILKWHKTGANAQAPAIDYVVNELEALGYRWAYRVVDLLAFGAPHKRRRVFVVASLHGDPRDVLLSQNSDCQGECVVVERRPCYDCFVYDNAASAAAGESTDAKNATTTVMESASMDFGERSQLPLRDVCQCLTTTSGARTCVAIRRANHTHDVVKLTIEDAERLMGFPAGYTDVDSVSARSKRSKKRRRLANSTQPPSLSIRDRFHFIGNACAVQQSEWIGHRLSFPYAMKFACDAMSAAFEEPCPGRKDASKSWPLAAYNVLSFDGDMRSAAWASSSSLSSLPPAWMRRRRAPKFISERPFVRGFLPLGVFLRSSIKHAANRVAFERRRTYYDRLVAHGFDDIDTFVRKALLSAPDANVVDDASSMSSIDDDVSGENDDDDDNSDVSQSFLSSSAQKHDDKSQGFESNNVTHSLARDGHVGAALAELKDAAIGQRIRVLWPAMQNKFFAATVTSFDAQAGTFQLDYDDGDVDAAFKPWNEHVCFIRQNDSDGGDNDGDNDKDDVITTRSSIDLSTPPQPSRVMRTNAKGEAVEIGSVV
eukprot:CAMPEP_0179707626 /NCGR_PEP_ID=MMETSP0937-20121108/4959_1 /TAXON_ID=548131 ORGANISM="Ostreococcus mediterraneus, Strain clade-D-RCC2593" /NCGR_SAMPLE_ID=MMETSP0937 /ASSEMBLY_ACC=CAM_ASM_000575 /LENGTH=657 /DNA_ID=CAMNT_0021580935 /DNA_START=3921 /DNA_END=5894 /DNA_ORIENTATION=-